MARAKQHTDYARFCRAAWDHPFHPAAINVTDCPVLGIVPGEGGHSMRHRGERPGGQVYPVTLDQDRTGRTLLHWTTRPYKLAPASSQSQEPNVMICAVPSACR